MEIVIAGLMYLGIVFAPDGNDQSNAFDEKGSETGIVLDDGLDD